MNEFYDESATDIVALVISDLKGRNGFDWVWADIDDETKLELLKELHNKVYTYLVERC